MRRAGRVILPLALAGLCPPAWPQRLRLPLLPRAAVPVSAPLPALPAPTIPPPTALPAPSVRPQVLLRDPLVLGAADAGAPEAAQAAGQLFDGGAVPVSDAVPTDAAPSRDDLAAWRDIERGVLQALGLDAAGSRCARWRDRATQALRAQPEAPLEHTLARALGELHGLDDAQTAEAEAFLASGFISRPSLPDIPIHRLIRTPNGIYSVSDLGLLFLGPDGWDILINAGIDNPSLTPVSDEAFVVSAYHQGFPSWRIHEISGNSVTRANLAPIAPRSNPQNVALTPVEEIAHVRRHDGSLFLEVDRYGLYERAPDGTYEFLIGMDREDKDTLYATRPTQPYAESPFKAVARWKGRRFAATVNGLFEEVPRSSVKRKLLGWAWRRIAAPDRRVTQLEPHDGRLFALLGWEDPVVPLGFLHEYDGRTLKPVLGLPGWDKVLALRRLAGALLAWVGDDLYEFAGGRWKPAIAGDIGRFDEGDWIEHGAELFVFGKSWLHVRGPGGWRRLPRVGSIKGIADLDGRRFAATSKGLYRVSGDDWTLLREQRGLTGIVAKNGRLYLSGGRGIEELVIPSELVPDWRSTLLAAVSRSVDAAIRAAGSPEAAMGHPADSEGTITDEKGLPLFSGLGRRRGLDAP